MNRYLNFKTPYKYIFLIIFSFVFVPIFSGCKTTLENNYFNGSSELDTYDKKLKDLRSYTEEIPAKKTLRNTLAGTILGGTLGGLVSGCGAVLLSSSKEVIDVIKNSLGFIGTVVTIGSLVGGIYVYKTYEDYYSDSNVRHKNYVNANLVNIEVSCSNILSDLGNAFVYRDNSIENTDQLMEESNNKKKIKPLVSKNAELMNQQRENLVHEKEIEDRCAQLEKERDDITRKLELANNYKQKKRDILQIASFVAGATLAVTLSNYVIYEKSNELLQKLIEPIISVPVGSTLLILLSSFFKDCFRSTSEFNTFECIITFLGPCIILEAIYDEFLKFGIAMIGSFVGWSFYEICSMLKEKKLYDSQKYDITNRTTLIIEMTRNIQKKIKSDTDKRITYFGNRVAKSDEKSRSAETTLLKKA